MNNIVENGKKYTFANGQSTRDLRDNSTDTQTDLEDLREHADSSDGLEALRKDSDEDLERRIELPDRIDGKRGTSGGSPLFSRSSKRILLLAMLILALGAVAPFAWNYLQSYESTDDAQIDGHIDPLSSRIDGTVIRVHAEDDDRVKAGELLVEIDPRDYEVAVEQAKARLELALAQVASAKQDYAAALANTRETDADNFKAQRDAQRYSALLDRAGGGAGAIRSVHGDRARRRGESRFRARSRRLRAQDDRRAPGGRRCGEGRARSGAAQSRAIRKSTRRPTASSASAPSNSARESSRDRR